MLLSTAQSNPNAAPNAAAPALPGGAARGLWLAWVAFVVYGSLVPLQYQALPWPEALARFAAMPMLDIGIEGRADWIANGVLYLPVGLLAALAFARPGRGPGVVAGLAALAFGWALALAVEFAQIYFPPRTVSRNDLLAEAIGTLLGVALAWRARRWLPALSAVWQGHWRNVSAALAPAGATAVLLLGWFPYDLLVSASEIAAKAAGPLWGWWRAPAFADEPALRQAARLLAEAVVVAPLGLLWARAWSGSAARAAPASASAPLGRALLLGAGLGLLVEAGQWFVASGLSQGASVLTRAAGWIAGAWLWNTYRHRSPAAWRALLGRWLVPLVLLHAAAVALLSGWFDGPWRSPAEAAAFAQGVHWVPFYYHHVGSSEAEALFSVMAIALLFAPVALWTWVRGGSAAQAALAAALASALIEAGKLFPLAERPDVTNPLVAAGAAALGLLLLQRFLAEPGPAGPAADGSAAASPAAATPRRTGSSARLPLLALAAVAALWLADFPLLRLPLALLLAAVAAAVWWRPVWLLGIAAAALPLLQLSAWSGREYVDEFDLLLLVGFGVALLRLRRDALPLPPADPALRLALGAVAAAFGTAALIGWSPWDLRGLADPGSTLSAWHALRGAKGLVWALCLAALARRLLAAGQPVLASFGKGLVVGLAGVVAVVVWERVAFVSLLDVASAYRVAGPIVAMKLGGAYLDACLIVALPFALLGVVRARRAGLRAGCAAIALGTAYAVGVTFTRTTYLALAVVCVLCALMMLRPWPRSRLVLAAATTLALMSAIAYPVITGPFATTRLAQIEPDLVNRQAFWADALALSQPGLATTLFGNGLSRYPAQAYWERASSPSPRPMAVHRFVHADGRGQLQLGPGLKLYVDQVVEVQPSRRVTVDLVVRASDPAARLGISLCHKWLLSSADCQEATLGFAPAAGAGWQPLQVELSTGVLGGDRGLLRRPVRFTLHNAGPGRIDVDRVGLRDAEGRELLVNGGFDDGGDRWTHTDDDHLAWHVKNLLLLTWFETGAFGTLALASLLGLAAWRSGRAAWSGDRLAQALAAALAGLMVIAVFDSVIDEPRFMFLLLALAVLGAMSRPAGAIPRARAATAGGSAGPTPH